MSAHDIWCFPLVTEGCGGKRTLDALHVSSSRVNQSLPGSVSGDDEKGIASGKELTTKLVRLDLETK